ncbi:2771_t:CDS:2 [Paraglomus brasilianum]|uniref:2771_t:CDS:1 n=1 Tax=Paraglomus brasilianum TaxID=144538 RepID=A0A9N9CYE5_9GLOM|nr:2771_t:CDS:2 [Paraglomus brasilianum]
MATTGNPSNRPSDHYSNESFDVFTRSRSVRNTFAALFCLWVIWSLLWLLRLCFSRSAKSGETDRESADRGTTDRAGATNSGGRFQGKNIKRAHEYATHLLLGLLSALVVNSLGRGSGVSVEVIAWVYFGLALIWLAAELMGVRIARLILGPIEAILLLVIFIIAWSWGWPVWVP